MSILSNSNQARNCFRGKRILFALILLSIPQVIQAQASYSRYYRPPFEYYYAGREVEPLEQLDRGLREIVPDILDRLQAELPDTIRIDLPMTRSEFALLTRGRVPEWAGGVAYPANNRIVAKAPAFFNAGAALEVLVAHEIVHLILAKATNQNGLPRWFEEGFAQLLAGENRSHTSSRLARAALADRLMGLPRVDDVLGFTSADADLAYAESNAAAIGLSQRFGWEAVRAILQAVAAGEEFGKGFQDATGMEYEAWQADWLESAQKKYRNFAFLDVDSLIWIFISLLMAVAAVVVWIRKRIAMKRWLAEEETDADEDHSDDPEMKKENEEHT
jgi:hypothetical protein